jgi:acetyltransferase
MLNKELINPKSIVVIGASNNVHTPGGSVLKNLVTHHFKGELFAVNPKETEVQGLKCHQNVSEIPSVDLAIIAIAAKFTLETVQILARKKNTKAFIIFSAGFGEKDEEGKKLEQQIVQEIKAVGGTLLGPNNIGLINPNYAGVFTSPIPKLNPKGVDFISGSGATAVFILEAAMATGLPFSSVFSLGNSAQIGVEDVLEHLDDTFEKGKSSMVKLLYMESIGNPQKFIKHSTSLIQKGCRIAAIKAGSSSAGSRAASSHTGALANSDVAVDALFKKSGIVRCYGRNELITVAGIFLHKELKGKNIAIITHAGGPAVMLTDTLSKNGLNIPEIAGKESEALLEKLFLGSSVSNPIDFLATGNAGQLETIIDYCENKFSNIDAMVPDEVLLGNAMAKIFKTSKPVAEKTQEKSIDLESIRSIINQAKDGYLEPQQLKELLIAAKIPIVQQVECDNAKSCIHETEKIGFPVVMKVVGPTHKSDVGGIVLNINSMEQITESYDKIMQIEGAKAVLIQPMKKGLELFIGAKKEGNFGHLVLCGLGGIYIEVLNDVNATLAPVSKVEAFDMIQNLKSYKIIQGIRNQEGINENIFAEIIVKISDLIMAAPEIAELDLNPLLGNSREIFAVDARIRIEKNREN